MIYTAAIYEEDFDVPGKEYNIQVFAKFIPAHRPYFADGEPDDESQWSIVDVLCDGEKCDIEQTANKLYAYDYKERTEYRMTEDQLIEKLMSALNDQADLDDCVF